MGHDPASLAGRRVLITGAGGAYAGRGMGRVIATTFARAGARVAAADIDLDAAHATAADIIEYDLDTARAAESMLLNRTPMKFPDIRFIFSHSGGALMVLAARDKVHLHTTAYPLADFARA